MLDDRSVSPGGAASQIDAGTEPGDGPGRGADAGAAIGGRRPAAAVTVREVAWLHLAAVALRESQAAEMLLRYSGRPQGLAGEAPAQGRGAVAYTGAAFTPDGLPVGHAALRWNDDDIELQRVYVTPPHRRSGTAAALLAAAEEAARALHVRRIILWPGDQQFDDAGFWERAGYTPVASIVRASECFEKLIAGDLATSPE